MIDKVVIVGSGALATFYAFRWSKKFEIAVLASWQESINALNSGENQERRKIKATSKWKTIKEPDLVVWITKTYKNEESLNRYSSLNWKCPILILQNGIGQESIFKSVLGSNQILLRGITTQGVKLTCPGYVLNTGFGNVIVEKNIIFDRFPVVQTEDIQTEIYLKLAINAVLNPIAAIFRVTNKDAISGKARKSLKELIDICYPYFKKRKIFTSEEDYLSQVEIIARNTGENKNSMLIDKESKRKTEILEILGPINSELNSKELTKLISLINY